MFCEIALKLSEYDYMTDTTKYELSKIQTGVNTLNEHVTDIKKDTTQLSSILEKVILLNKRVAVVAEDTTKLVTTLSKWDPKTVLVDFTQATQTILGVGGSLLMFCAMVNFYQPELSNRNADLSRQILGGGGVIAGAGLCGYAVQPFWGGGVGGVVVGVVLVYLRRCFFRINTKLIHFPLFQ